MNRHAEPDPPRARGRHAVVQWVLLAVFALAFLILGIGLVTAAIHAVTEWTQSGEPSRWAAAMADLGRFGFPFALALGVLILLGFLIRDCIYRLIGKRIPPGSGGGVYV